MEEILASIRRIIAGDGTRAPSAERPAGAPARLDVSAMGPPPAGPLDDVPPWSMAAAILAAPAPSRAEIAALDHTPIPDDAGALRVSGEVAAGGEAAADATSAEPDHHGAGPAEPSAAAPSPKAVASQPVRAPVFETLGDTVVGSSTRTLEELVTQMLRPILRSWLDDHLPGLVERMVKAEIERVSRGHSPLREG